jgi:hypothetical protein
MPASVWQYPPQVFFVIAGSLFAIPIFSAVTMGLEVALKWWMEERPAEAENPGESERGVEKEHPVDEERPAERKQSEEKNRGLRRKCWVAWID